MPMRDPYTGEIIPDPVAPTPQFPVVQPYQPPPFQAPPQVLPQLPPAPLTVEERIKQMGGWEAFGNALAALGAPFTPGAIAPSERLNRQYIAEQEPWRVKAQSAQEQARTTNEANLRASLAAYEAQTQAGMQGARLGTEAGMQERGLGHLAGLQQSRIAAEERMQASRLAAEETSKQKDRVITLLTSKDPRQKLMGMQMASGIAELAPYTVDAKGQKYLMDLAEAHEQNQLSFEKLEVEKNQLEVSKVKQVNAILAKQAAGKQLSGTEQILVGIRDKLQNYSPYETLKYEQLVKLSKDPKYTDLILSALTGVDAQTMLINKVAANNGGDWLKAIEKVQNLKSTDLDALAQIMKAANLLMSDPNADKYEKGLAKMLLMKTVGVALGKMGEVDKDLANLNFGDIGKMIRDAVKGLENKYKVSGND